MTEHIYIVLLTDNGESYDEPEAFGPFSHYDDARAYGDRLVADSPNLRVSVLPVKPAE